MEYESSSFYIFMSETGYRSWLPDGPWTLRGVALEQCRGFGYVLTIQCLHMSCSLYRTMTMAGLFIMNDHNLKFAGTMNVPAKGEIVNVRPDVDLLYVICPIDVTSESCWLVGSGLSKDMISFSSCLRSHWSLWYGQGWVSRHCCLLGIPSCWGDTSP